MTLHINNTYRWMGWNLCVYVWASTCNCGCMCGCRMQVCTYIFVYMYVLISTDFTWITVHHSISVVCSATSIFRKNWLTVHFLYTRYIQHMDRNMLPADVVDSNSVSFGSYSSHGTNLRPCHLCCMAVGREEWGKYRCLNFMKSMVSVSVLNIKLRVQ